MKIWMEGLSEAINCGMKHFAAWHGLKLEQGGLEITVAVNHDGCIRIVREGMQVTFALDREYQAFRALTILLEKKENQSFVYEEQVQFKTCGVMFDGSQATSLMNGNSFREMIVMLAGMGYNTVMMYCEDCFELDGEPYWGYMRPKYTKQDFKEMDDFAYSFGIEMIPCIQTLGHLPEAIKRVPYQAISDTPSVLMVGEPAVYVLIEKIIAQVSSCFRSKRIHVGLDEAWGLGCGAYLQKNGYVPQPELMRRHVKEVYKLIEKYGLSPMMWADMFFRAKADDGEYYNPKVELTEEDRKGVPKKMSLIYWDYYHMNTEEYEELIKKHLFLTDRVMFAGCVRNTRTFASHYKKTEATTDAALAACKKHGIQEVFATVWGDDHRESSTFTALPGLQLYAEHMYALTPDKQRLKQRFQACTGMDREAFMDIDKLDRVPAYNGENIDNLSLTRAFIWQDIMLGLCDRDIAGIDCAAYYRQLKERFLLHASTYPKYKEMFEFYYHVADVIEVKADLGIRLRQAYLEDDRKKLQKMAEEMLPDLSDRMKALHHAHRTHFYCEYKPMGWDVLDIRYGGAVMRIDTIIMRLKAYLEGSVSGLEELDEERLSLSGNDYLPLRVEYMELCSATKL